jgi:hypothetical protein
MVSISNGCMFPAGFSTIDIGLSRKVRDAGDVADRDSKGHLEGVSDLGRKFGQNIRMEEREG